MVNSATVTPPQPQTDAPSDDQPSFEPAPAIEARPLPSKPKLLVRVREAIRTRQYSDRTEEAYVQWIRRYIFFHELRHPAEMGADEVQAFLSDLAVRRNVSASTQTQALSALVFLYRHVIGKDVGWLDKLIRAKRPRRLPVVLTADEVDQVFGYLKGPSCWSAGSCTVRACACSSASACGSKTWTSNATRSPSATGRVARTD